MNILYIYRSKNSGPSIRRVFEPIEQELRKNVNIDSLYLPVSSASPIAILKNIRFVLKYLQNKQYDIIHITGDVNYIAYALRNYKVVITIHDLGHYVKLSASIRKLVLYFLFVRPLKNATFITYISEKSKAESDLAVRINPQRQVVIYNPVNPIFTPSEMPKGGVPIILHIGTKPAKNLNRVVEALVGIECKLHIIGNVTEDIQKRIKELGINAVIKSNVSDEEIVKAYRSCNVISFPSMYEGFGMPIIEGQAIGRPVVTSNISPMNTLAGESAILVDPYSVESIRDGFKRALIDEEIIVKGFENVKKFGICNVADKYLSLYKNIFNKQ